MIAHPASASSAAFKVAGRGALGDHLLQRSQRPQRFPSGHLAALCLDNFVQDHVIILNRDALVKVVIPAQAGIQRACK